MDRLLPFAASVRNGEPRSRELLRSYPDVVNYLLNKNATNQVIAWNEAAITRYVQPPNMTPQECAKDLISKSCKVADVNDESSLNDMFIESVDMPICYSLRNQYATNSQADLTNIVFQGELLLSMQKGSENNSTRNYPNTNPANPYIYKSWNSCNVLSIVNTETTATLTRRTRCHSPSSQMPEIHALSILSSRQAAAQSISASMPSVYPSLHEVCYKTCRLTPKCPILTQGSLAQLVMVRSRNMQTLFGMRRQECPNRPYTYRCNRFCNR